MTRSYPGRPAAGTPVTTGTSGVLGEERSWLIFRLGTQIFCASTLDVDGIIERPSTITAIPKMPVHALGAFLFRDHSALAISLRTKLRVSEGEDGAKCPFIVARLGETRVALCVDEVLDVIGAGDVSWTPMPEMLGGDLFDFYAIRDGNIILHTSFRRLVEAEVDFESIGRWSAQHRQETLPHRPDASAPASAGFPEYADISGTVPPEPPVQPASDTSRIEQTPSTATRSSLPAPEARIAQPLSAEVRAATRATGSSAGPRLGMSHVQPGRPDLTHRTPATPSGDVKHSAQGFGATQPTTALNASHVSSNGAGANTILLRADSTPAHHTTVTPPSQIDAEAAHVRVTGNYGQVPPPHAPLSARGRETSARGGQIRWVAGALLAAVGFGWFLYALTPGREDRSAPATETGRDTRSSSVSQAMEAPITSSTTAAVRAAPAMPNTDLANPARAQHAAAPSSAREEVVLESDAVTVTITRASKKQATPEATLESAEGPVSQPAPPDPRTAAKTHSPDAGNVYTHVVRQGETLSGIAKTYLRNAHRYPELARLSGIENPHLIYPGDTVRIAVRRSPR